MKWASAISEQNTLKAAVREAAERVKADLGSETPDLLMVFVSNTHRAEYDQVPDIIADISPVENLIGCSGEVSSVRVRRSRTGRRFPSPALSSRTFT